jgi:motility quorum-sensing regulator/GCU-specific mRNA interferase toxin
VAERSWRALQNSHFRLDKLPSWGVFCVPAIYPLFAIKAAVAKRGVAAFTRSALLGIREAGLTTDEAQIIVQRIRPPTFYKTMPAEQVPGEWQDVYRVPGVGYPDLCVKFTLRANGKIVISFKPR